MAEMVQLTKYAKWILLVELAFTLFLILTLGAYDQINEGGIMEYLSPGRIFTSILPFAMLVYTARSALNKNSGNKELYALSAICVINLLFSYSLIGLYTSVFFLFFVATFPIIFINATKKHP